MKWFLCALLLLTLGLLVKCTNFFYAEYENFPDYAKKEVVYKQYQGLIQSVDLAIESSDSFLSLAAQIEKVSFPQGMLRVELKHEGEEPTIIFKTQNISSRRSVLINGSGYGRLGDTDVIIIDYPIHRYGVESCRIYIEDQSAQEQ